jgi:TP901 family phage tail tape measure protein
MASKTLKASVVIGGTVSSAFRSAISTTKNGLKQVGEEIARVERKQRLLANNIDTFRRMGRSADQLGRTYADLARHADRLRASQARLANVQGRIDANNARRQELGGRFRGAAGMFGATVVAALAPIRSAVAFENAMLGVAKQVNGARDAAGNLTPVYFSMAQQIQRLGREIPLATNQLADMVAAGARMGVAKDELIQFTRTGAMMADAFDLPAGQLADDMGKIAGLFQIPIPRIGELADAINYLDDNAKSSGGDIIDVMRRIGGVARTLRMPAKEAAALGSTFLTLGSSAEVAGTASNAVMRILGAASVQSKRVRKGMEDLGFNPEGLEKSMSKDATGTILSVLDALNKLPDEKRMAAATRLFGAEYGDDVAKLSTGIAEYRKQLQLVNGEQQKGSMSREFNARLKTAGAQWQITKNRMTEVAVTVGGALLPAINDLMKSVAPMIEGFGKFARAHPGVIKGVVGTAFALTGMRVASLGVGYAWTTIMGPLLKLRQGIAMARAASALYAAQQRGVAAASAFARTSVMSETAAIRAQGVAATTTAGKLAALARRAALTLAVANVADSFAGQFGVGQTKADQAKDDENWQRANWWERSQSAVPRGIEKVGRALGMTNMADQAQADRVKAESAYLEQQHGERKPATVHPAKRAPSKALPAMPIAPARKRATIPAVAAGGRGTSIVDNSTTTIHVHQQPGESAEALAQRIRASLKKDAGVAKRGSLIDG